MTTKTDVVASIKTITVGERDSSNNKVVNVLAKHNEFVIYEIETNDINNRLKVFIDGHTDASEAALQGRFNRVKQKYIEAKGMLSKSSNFEMMKHRIAHTLSSCLSSDETDGKKEFSELISTIVREHEELVTNRAIYLAPAFGAIILLFVACLVDMNDRLSNTPTWQVLTLLLASSLGGGVSILANAKTLNFEEFKTKLHYLMLGIERILLAFVAGGIVFIALKAGALLPTFMSANYWSFMLVLVVAGFSESFVPGFLSKTESSLHSNAFRRTNH